MSVFSPVTASIQTSPPRPPSPPSGPPNSMNFSRRKPTQPAPPLPERMEILAWSRKFMARVRKRKGGTANRSPFADPVGWERLFGRHLGGVLGRRWDHVHLDLAAGAGAEGDDAVGSGEQGVIAADADVGARIHLGAALADQDVAGQHLLAAEALDAQPLAVRIAAVARGAACFLVCHL